MAKKKKKSKQVDARGYGQVTVFRQSSAPPPKEEEQETGDAPPTTTAAASSLSSRGPQQEEQEWETAALAQQEELTTPPDDSNTISTAMMIPPRANITLPSSSLLHNDATTKEKVTAVNAISNLVFSPKMYTLLEELVTPLAPQSFLSTTTPTTTAAHGRWIVKKMAYLYDYLRVLGVPYDDIQAAVTHLVTLLPPQAILQLATVLDWMTYTLPVDRLPTRFLEEHQALAVRIQTATDGGDSNDELPEPAANDPEEEKTWPPSHDDTDTTPKLEPLLATEPPMETEKTAEEIQLEQLQQELDAVTAEYQDEASKYMMSKQEIKDLEKRYKLMQKQVQRYQNRVQAARRRRQEEIATAVATSTENNDDEDDDLAFSSGGFFDLQLPSTKEEPGSVTPDDASIPRQEIPQDAIPPSWTGQTPRQILEDRCRRLGLSRPSFQKLDSNNACRITIFPGSSGSGGKGPPLLKVQEEARFDRFVDAQHYVATLALYQLDPTLPIYRSLPPFYRDLWKSWVDEADQARMEKEQAEETHRKEQILQLISLLPQTTELEVDQSPSDAQENGVDQFASFSLSTNDDSKEENERMRKEFEARVQTKRYRAMLTQRQKLPVFAFREDILTTVLGNPVTVLSADTGAGKSTQVPQFLLEHALQNGTAHATSILCTQPRRVAATSLAERVSEEMACKLGSQVGYSIRLDNKSSSDTRLLFCTTGVILRRLIEDPLLRDVSCVVVDEVHERQWQIDVLLVSLRRLVRGPRSDLKVVLMSATLDAKLFCNFFFGAPLIAVPGRTFPVSTYFLEDLIEATGHIVEDDAPNARRNYRNNETASFQVSMRGGKERKQIVSVDSEVDPTISEDYLEYSLPTRRTMERVEESILNYDLIEDVLHLLLIETNVDHMLKAPEGKMIDNGALLVFLPGIGEIRTLCDRLQTSKFFNDRKTFDIIPLHSALSSAEQRRAFIVPRKVRWAIVVCTNIAETSVTIPDAVCVIDSGRVRELRHDKRTLTRRLVATWCSRASTKQRTGRAGRVQPGICLRLFSSRTHTNSMSATTEPELQRLPLEEVCLTVLAGGLASNQGCAAFLDQAPQAPKKQAIETALVSLEQVGAIRVPIVDNEATNDHLPPAVETLTPLGLQLAKLPVDARLGKMLLLATQFRCVDTIATIVAGLSASQSPFLRSIRDEQAAAAKQARFRHENSDFLTLLNLYDAFLDAGETFHFCRQHFVSYQALREIKEARKHYLELLLGMGWLETNTHSRNVNAQNEVVLHAVIAAALSQMARIDRAPGGKDISLWHRSIGGPEQQVYVHNSSVNAKLSPRRRLPSRWLVFFEKFGTGSSRVSISMTAFCSPLAVALLAGHSFEVHHAARKVTIAGWMDFHLAATTGVRIHALRRHLQDLHKEDRLVDGVLSLLKEDAEHSVLSEAVTTS